MMASHDKKELITAFKKCKAIEFGNFILSSGKESEYYIDIKKVMTNPFTLRLTAKALAVQIKKVNCDIIGGVALGGVPIATAVSLETDIPVIFLRKSAKDYGTGGRLVGQFDTGNRIILIEDVTTSGGSAIEAVSVIRKLGGIVENVITVVDREEGAAENLAKINVDLQSLICASDLLENK